MCSSSIFYLFIQNQFLSISGKWQTYSHWPILGIHKNDILQNIIKKKIKNWNNTTSLLSYHQSSMMKWRRNNHSCHCPCCFYLWLMLKPHSLPVFCLSSASLFHASSAVALSPACLLLQELGEQSETAWVQTWDTNRWVLRWLALHAGRWLLAIPLKKLKHVLIGLAVGTLGFSYILNLPLVRVFKYSNMLQVSSWALRHNQTYPRWILKR